MGAGLRAYARSATKSGVADSDPRLALNPDGGLDTLVDLRKVSLPAADDGNLSLSGGVPSIILDPNKFRFDRMLTTRHLVYGVPTPFVGRRAELEVIYNAVRDAVNETALRTIYIQGGPGSGKTRLLAEMFHIIEPVKRGIAVLSGVCSQTDASEDVGVIGQLLRRHFDIGAQESDGIVAEKIRLAIAHLLSPDMLETGTRHLGYLMGLPPSDLGRHGEPGTLNAFRDRALRTFYKLLAYQGQNTTQILVFHRAQFMTEGARRVVAGLRAALKDTRSVLFLVGDGAADDSLADAGGFDERVELTPLSQRHMELMVRGILTKVEDPPQSLIDQIVAQAAGCPRLVEDNIRLLVQRGVIRLGEPTWEIHRDESSHTGELARSVEAASQARISGMSAETRHILQMAAIFGPTFWGGGVLAMLRVRPIGPHRASQPWFEDEAARWLESELVSAFEADLVHPTEPAKLDGQREFSFIHQTDREALYEGIDPSTRAFYHRLAAQWFASLRLSEPGPWYEVIAEHLVAGARPEQASKWFIKSARLARAHYDLDRSVVHYRRALALVDVDRLDLLLPLLRGLGECLYAIGEFEPARRVVSALLEASLAARERDTGAWAWLMLGKIHRNLADHARARPCLENARNMYDDMGDEAGEASVLGEVGKLCWVEGGEGAYDDALVYYERSLLIRRRLGDEKAIAESLGSMATIHLKRAEISRAEATYREALQLRRQLGDQVGEIVTLVGLGAVYHARGELKEALEEWNRGLDLATAGGDRDLVAVFLNNIGETRVTLGELDEASLALGQAAQVAAETGDQRTAADIYRNQAELARARGNLDEATGLVDEAIRITTSLGLKPSQGRALWTRAAILHQGLETAGDSAEARAEEACETYERALEIFEEAGDALELRDALGAFANLLDTTGDEARATKLRGRAERLQRG
jgi:tetratricopeptide (TPR) repeat protein